MTLSPPTSWSTEDQTMAASAKTITTVRRPSAPRVLLATRAHVDLHEAGLTSIAGTFVRAFEFESVFISTFGR